jgi:hypothetical protein
MSRGITKWWMWVAVVIFVCIPLAALAAEPMTIEGQVNENYQIIDGTGQVYEVADTTQGNDLVENHIGEKVKVTGTIEQDQDTKIITVTTFTIVSE